MNVIELICVDPSNKNKFYRMVDDGSGNFTAYYGRVGGHESKETYSISKWNTKYKEKLKKGYVDVTHLKAESSEGTININTDIQDFYTTIKKYTSDNFKKNYTIAVGAVTQSMISEAQGIIDDISNLTSDDLDKISQRLIQLFTVIPRRMSKVSDHLPNTSWDNNKLQKVISFEQDTLDGLSSNIITSTKTDISLEDVLGAKLELETDPVIIKQLTEFFETTKQGNRRIKKILKVINSSQEETYKNWINQRSNKEEKLLFHGTRNANVFSIIKNGLLIRPSNAAVYSGSAYGDGTYFSRHAAKSLNYTGYDSDKILFINTVNTGNPFIYDGWYRDGKSLSRSNMNYNYLNSKGYDSLWVKAGDGLLADEMICYNQNQYKHSYLLWVM